MEVPAGQDGIQRLLQAEQEAQAIVAKARKGEPALLLLFSSFKRQARTSKVAFGLIPAPWPCPPLRAVASRSP